MKRTSYISFKKWVESNEGILPKNDVPYISWSELNKDFNESYVLLQYRNLLNIDNKKIQAKTKFNGKLLMNYLNLGEKDGKVVGSIMKEIRGTMLESEYIDYIIETDLYDLICLSEDYYNRI